jgi:hypothetical protein
VSAPLHTVDAKNAVHGVAPPGLGADSVSLFRALRRVPAPGGGTATLVEALPLTGRSHQLRVHLAWLGYPIVDDPVYCEEAAAALCSAAGAGGEAVNGGANAGAGAGAGVGVGADAAAAAGASPQPPAVGAPAPTGQVLQAALLRACVACNRGLAAEFSPLQRLARGICLHSCEYVSEGEWRVAAPLPGWACAALEGRCLVQAVETGWEQ